jgi:hypothetical protein
MVEDTLLVTVQEPAQRCHIISLHKDVFTLQTARALQIPIFLRHLPAKCPLRQHFSQDSLTFRCRTLRHEANSIF